MKKLAISQRVDEHKVYRERRDGLDQRWFEQNEWSKLGLPKPVRYLLETHLENSEK